MYFPVRKSLFLIHSSLQFVPVDRIDNKSAMVQVMTWHQTGAKSLPEPMLTYIYDIV